MTLVYRNREPKTHNDDSPECGRNFHERRLFKR